MKHFLLEAAIIFAFGIVFVLGIESLQRMIHGDNVYSFKYDYMEKNASKIKTLLLGHSLFEESFNSNVLGDGTFNLAICGRVSYYDVKLLERYIDRMDSLQVVIFPVHYALDNACTYFDDWHLREAYVYHYYKYMKITTPGQMQLYYSPKITFQWERKNKGEIIDSVDKTGYGQLPDAKHHITAPSLRLYTQLFPYNYCVNLKRIARICHENNVRFIAITPPATNTFLAYTTLEGFTQLNNIIEEIRQDSPIEYHNYIADSSFRADSLYHDATHLNHKGATLFAERVKKDFFL
jgi:hypothetical protein